MKKAVIGGIAAAVIIGIAVAGVSMSGQGAAGMIDTSNGSPVVGNADAPITIVEFGDYQCHQCYNWFHNTKPGITEEYIETGMVKFVFVDMAFLGRDSLPASVAAYCAGDQGMYWEYHDMLYTLQDPQIDSGWASRERLKAFAFDLGLDPGVFDGCLDSNKHQGRVQSNVAEAREFGVSGTPTFAIIFEDGRTETIVGAQPFSVFKNVLDSTV
ncbi:protein-disulfide isomerase [Cenarchaeum symbiosum A]|uniref:Protein-disulfide isomerase n=1 Tax=Cenarchaeum symbiosum (strain A) TaxID=414004 RepID=A0RU49_CENSY|nr:protein-disulfide isomerase [Cenarchaeum symbiosum A]